MILLIDNYDSFSYNLYQLVGEFEPNIRVIRNDEMTAEEIRALRKTESYRKSGIFTISQCENFIIRNLSKISKRRKSAISECADAIRDLQKQYEQLKAVKLRLYEKYTSGSITKAEYLKRKAETDTKMSENEEAIQRGHQRMQELDSEHPCSDER